jgi:predicted dienelactone hydrolase
MRALLLLALLLLIAPAPRASAETDWFHAGISRFTVPGSAPFDALVWYPTDAAEAPWDTNGFSIPATHDASIAPGPFPIVLLSHGGGVGGGNPLILRELSSALARHGFVVVAPFHGTSRLLQRPFQVREAIDQVTADPRFKSHVDPARLGMIGFSLGAAVTLMLAGATPDFAHLDAYCDAHPTDAMSCDHAPGGGGRRTAAPLAGVSIPLPPPLPLKAIVLLDPFGALFSRDHLTAVTTFRGSPSRRIRLRRRLPR